MTEECVPNVFSPNNDDINDFWNLEQAYIYSDTEVKIYGRFGREIYESVGYDNPWDGKNSPVMLQNGLQMLLMSQHSRIHMI